jgi:hypothetical protein
MLHRRYQYRLVCRWSGTQGIPFVELTGFCSPTTSGGVDQRKAPAMQGASQAFRQ